MSTAAAQAYSPARRPRIAAIIVFWLGTASLIAGQYLLLHYLGALNRSLAALDGQILLPSAWWRLTGVAVPLLTAGTALAMQARWLGGLLSGLAGLGLVVVVPLAPLCLLLQYYMGPSALEAARVPDGGAAILAIDPGMTDTGFILVEDVDPGGFVWRRVSELEYIQDGPFAGRPHLLVSPDGSWLLVERAGIWTDAFRLVDGHPIRIGVPLIGDYRLPDDATFWRLRSARIAALTGVRP